MVDGSCCCRKSPTAASLRLGTFLQTRTTSWNGESAGRSSAASEAEYAFAIISSNSTLRTPQGALGKIHVDCAGCGLAANPLRARCPYNLNSFLHPQPPITAFTDPVSNPIASIPGTSWAS